MNPGIGMVVEYGGDGVQDWGLSSLVLRHNAVQYHVPQFGLGKTYQAMQ